MTNDEESLQSLKGKDFLGEIGGKKYPKLLMVNGGWILLEHLVEAELGLASSYFQANSVLGWWLMARAMQTIRVYDPFVYVVSGVCRLEPPTLTGLTSLRH